MATRIQSASERFVEKREGRWRLLASMLGADSRGKRLEPDEAAEFPRLYRRACRDLAEARARALSRDVVEYLNSLVGSAHSFLYRQPAAKRGGAGDFVALRVRGVVPRHPAAFSLAAAAFFVPLALAYLAVLAQPSLASSFVDKATMELFGDMYATASFDSGLASGAAGTAYYIQHNATISFLCFATGIVFGIGSLYFLIYNGLFLGAIGGYVAAMGHGANFWTFVTAHSALELSGVVFAGAAGIHLGSLVLRGGRAGRAAQLREGREEMLAMLAPAVAMIFLAAFVEGFVSGSSAPAVVRSAIFWVSSAFILALSFIPSRRARHG